jgi:hypothetical protein
MSGGALKAAQRYGQDYASGEFGNAYNRLANLADLGPRSAGVMSRMGQNYANAAGQNTMAGGQAVGQGYMNAGAARASGYLGMGNTAFNSLGRYLNYQQDQDVANSLRANNAGMYYTPGYGGGFTYGAQGPNVGPSSDFAGAPYLGAPT